VNTGEAKLSGLEVKREVLPSPVGKGASSAPAQPPVAAAPESAPNRAEVLLKAGIGVVFGPAAPAVGLALDNLFGGTSASPFSDSPSTASSGSAKASVPPPAGGLQNADSARGLIQDMEKSAAGNQERIQASMRGMQRDVLVSGKQDVAGVSHLDPNRGTLANTGLVLKGEAGEIIEQLSEKSDEYGLGESDKRIADNPERIQASVQGVQRDVLLGGKQDVSEVSNFDPDQGDLANAGLALKGEARKLNGQFAEKSGEYGLGENDKKAR
jgi:hypothetical protein